MEKYLYFRGAGVTDEDNDDGLAAGGAGKLTSLMVPASRFRGMVPGGSTSTVKMYFDSVKNYQGDAEQADENTVADYVILTVTAGKIREAMTDILRAINGSRPTQGGFLVIADDVTTNVAGATVSAEYVSEHITGIAANNIVVEVAHTGS
jgi:hypothetical protein